VVDVDADHPWYGSPSLEPDKGAVMRVVRTMIVGAVAGAAVVAGLVGPASSASAVAPPTPSVVTVDDSDSIWLSSAGSAPTKLRDGSPDVYPGVSSDDGSTSAWFLGAAMPQMVVTHNGTITRTVDDLQDTHELTYDVAAAAPVVAEALPSPTLAGRWDLHTIDATTGADMGSHTYGSEILDLWLSADGTSVYLLLGGTAWSVWKCSSTVLGSCARLSSLTTIPGASGDSAFPAWDTVSADGSTIAGVLDTGSDPATYRGWTLATSGTTAAVAGTTALDSTGRFVGNDLYVAEPGHLYDFTAGALDLSHPTNDTPMTMTGAPAFIQPAGSTYDGTFTAPTAFDTDTVLLRLLNGSLSTVTSQALPITTTMVLYPGTTAHDGSWPYLYWDKSVSHVQYSYDKVTWADFPWSTASLGVQRNIWLKAVHDGEINAAASSSAPVLISAKPVLGVKYTASTRTLSGVATVPDGTKLYVQRRISPNTWATYATPIVHARAYKQVLPALHAQWRVAALASPTYIQSISATVTT
jgi:hypothetical protein